MFEKCFKNPCNKCEERLNCRNKCSQRKTFDANKPFLNILSVIGIAMITCLVVILMLGK